MISVSNLEKSFGDRVLFQDAAFQLNPGERYGIVGANGCGKTTLLSILSGDADATRGSVSIPRSARLGVLRQDQFLYESESILNVTLMGTLSCGRAMVEKEKVLANAHEYFDADRFSELEDTVMRLDGYTAEARAAVILEGSAYPPRSTTSRCRPFRRLQAARAPGAGAGRQPGRPPARRAHEPPGHPLHPLAGEVPPRLRGARSR
jgi:ATPase subunit of ABC transporter with duplicated ATPase domains